MKKTERTERMRAISRLALGILRRCGDRGMIDRAGLRYRVSEVRHNEFKLTSLRPIDDQHGASTLDIRFDGKIVLHVEWMSETVIQTSYRPGEWEAMLTRYERVQALLGKV